MVVYLLGHPARGCTAAGKSVVCQHLAYGAVVDGHCLISLEPQFKALSKQLGSFGLGVSLLRDDQLCVYPIEEPIKDQVWASCWAPRTHIERRLLLLGPRRQVDTIGPDVGRCSPRGRWRHASYSSPPPISRTTVLAESAVVSPTSSRNTGSKSGQPF